MNMRVSFAAVCAVACVGLSGRAEVHAREVSLDERIVAQKAIEQVFWNHRIWPKENPGPKPPLAAVVPDAAIRAKVEDNLAKSNALERYWRHPISPEQLQAELDRMAASTQSGATLQELFQALGNDPELIAETLGRQALADRLIRNWYGADTRFHARTRAAAKAARAACVGASCLQGLAPDYAEVTWSRRGDSRPHALVDGKRTTVDLDPGEWADHLSRLTIGFGAQDGSIPVGRLSEIQESTDAFTITVVLDRSDDEMTTATASWPKRSFDDWWAAARPSLGTKLAQAPGRFTLPAVPSTGCANDTWTRTRFSGPDPRTKHIAVWTGTEMIVWGGASPGFVKTGGRYNPATDTWTPTSTGAGSPDPSYYPYGVWTGTELLVWGMAYQAANYQHQGARYNPATDSWVRTTTTSPSEPVSRYYFPFIWTGTELIVWGGWTGWAFVGDGARYNPSSDTWTPISSTNAPSARYGQSAVWTGSEMIVWGGEGPGDVYLNDGARYNPANDTWTPISTGVNVPSGRLWHQAVWTGTQMIVWGGYDDETNVNSGGRYTLATNSWLPTSLGANVPSGRILFSTVWTGAEMIVWGGQSVSGATLNTGGRYNPSNNSWASVSTGTNAPTARDGHAAVWTGTEMIVWGGSGSQIWGNGGRYKPSTNTWTPIANSPVAPRTEQSTVWTGSEMLVWGGTTQSATNSGGRYVPAIDTFTATSTAVGVPAARSQHTSVWTGTEMIVWGGGSGSSDFATGGRYNPATNAWSATSSVGVPAPRRHHTAVWTGSEMLVWGGDDSSLSVFNDGGRYNPASNGWTATSLGSNVPAPRGGHSAVWTGTEMIVWGGADGVTVLDSGGRYDPGTDAWLATSTGANVPSPRSSHTAVWTGTEMTVWGGSDGAELGTGGRYKPSNDTWLATSIAAETPAPRVGHTAVWTGEEMIVWGGSAQNVPFNSGARYKPLTDTWTPTSTGDDVPPAREGHAAVFTGTEMIVWSGTNLTEQGGRYCACPNGLGVYFEDADGDGHGNSGVSQPACNRPAGFVASSDDCNDGNPSVYAGAPELNDGLDNQCPGNPGYGIADEIADTLRVDSGGIVSWTDASGATTYDVARSPTRDLGSCTIVGSAGIGSPSVTDGTVPPPGAGFYYVVRASAPHVGSWGQRSSGAERILACP